MILRDWKYLLRKGVGHSLGDVFGIWVPRMVGGGSRVSSTLKKTIVTRIIRDALIGRVDLVRNQDAEPVDLEWLSHERDQRLYQIIQKDSNDKRDQHFLKILKHKTHSTDGNDQYRVGYDHRVANLIRRGLVAWRDVQETIVLMIVLVEVVRLYGRRLFRVFDINLAYLVRFSSHRRLSFASCFR